MESEIITMATAFVAGIALGGGAVAFALRSRARSEEQLSDMFKALAADTLRANNESFLHLAESRLKQSEQVAAGTLEQKSQAIDALMKPMQETLQKLNTQVQAIEVKREGAYQSLAEMVRASNEVQQQLRGETAQLLQALRSSNTRGRWGEMQLRRILEMTGMTEYARDFAPQRSLSSENGTLRPDYIISLPNGRAIIVDCKVPLDAYLESTQGVDETARGVALMRHAKMVRDHVRALSGKAYWDQIENTPEFVVMFMPGDHFLAAALDKDPALMDACIENRVVIATPMTLIALLRTVAFGWRQEGLAENTRKIGALGGELYSALATMSDHITGLGGKLTAGIDSYNKMIGSLERNVLSKARRLRDYGAGMESKSLPEALEPIDLQPRALTALESQQKDDAA